MRRVAVVAGFRFGDIVTVEIADPDGRNRKRRPALVVSPAGGTREGKVRVAAISSSHIPDPLPAACFELPWHRAGHTRTGLNRRSVAKCDWLAEVEPTQVLKLLGTAPPAVLLRIAAFFQAKESDANP